MMENKISNLFKPYFYISVSAIIAVLLILILKTCSSGSAEKVVPLVNPDVQVDKKGKIQRSINEDSGQLSEKQRNEPLKEKSLPPITTDEPVAPSDIEIEIKNTLNESLNYISNNRFEPETHERLNIKLYRLYKTKGLEISQNNFLLTCLENMNNVVLDHMEKNYTSNNQQEAFAKKHLNKYMTSRQINRLKNITN